ncbi:hypothetical protein FRC00_008613 [Tulasnella sp. 408]|nr:hypothetical protein FRC00_008613 [Tulasnella sp. 408]
MQTSILRQTAARQCVNTTTRRQISSSARRWQAEAATETAGATVVDAGSVRPKKPVGGFRGGVASAYASYRLLEEYKIASALLQASVEELQASTDKISTHIRRIETVEKNLKALSEASATKEESKKSKAELKKLYVSPGGPQRSIQQRKDPDGIDALTLPIPVLSASASSSTIRVRAPYRMVSMSALPKPDSDITSLAPIEQDLHALVKKEATSLRPS